MNYAFVRFTKTTDGSALTDTPFTIAVTGIITGNSVNMFKLYTVNPWLVSFSTATLFKDQLLNILTAYYNI